MEAATCLRPQMSLPSSLTVEDLPTLHEDDNKASLSSSSSQSHQLFRSEEYRQLFHLPPEEVLVQDFNCALQEKILLQGHMYLFERYVCFYSNIFGYEKKKIIKLTDVTCVRKAKTAGLFPNAIEIVSWGKKDFFASFLSRDEAFRLIVDGWSRHSSYARLFLSSQSLSIQNESHNIHLLPPQMLQDQERVPFAEADNEGRYNENNPIDSEDLNNVTALPRPSGQLALVEVEGGVGNISKASSCHFSDWDIEEEDAPELPAHYRLITESEFPVDVHQFFRLFYSDEALSFYEAFHKKCGDEDLQCKQWAKHRHFGHVRDVSFRHPINYFFGPKATYCQEVQRYRVYSNEHLIIETSQQMNDIPYGDYFRVEARWDVERFLNGSRDHCFVRIYIYVCFLKKTVWKGKIEQGTVDECKEAYTTWIQEAHRLLQEKGIVKEKNEPGEYVNPTLIQSTNHALGMLMRKKGRASIASNSFNAAKGRAEYEKARNSGDSCQGDITSIIGNHQSKKTRLNSSAETLGAKRGPPDSVETSTIELRPSVLNQKLLDRIKSVLLIFLVAIFLLTQVGIIIALARSSRVEYIQTGCNFMKFNEEHCRSCSRSPNKDDVLTWLEQQTYLLREGLAVSESQLRSLQSDLSLVKAQMQLLQKKCPEYDLGGDGATSSN